MEDLRKATSGTSEFTDVDIAVYLRICTSAEVGGDLGDLTYDDALSALSRISALRKLRASVLQIQLSRANNTKQKNCELAGCVQ